MSSPHSESTTIRTLRPEHFPDEDDFAVQVMLFHNVTNASFLHHQLLSRNSEFEYAFIDATVIVSEMQIYSAIFRALFAKRTNQLYTPNVHSEIVFSLNPSRNIAEAYRHFGISPTSTSVLVISNSRTAENMLAHLTQHVQGEPADLSDLAGQLSAETDWSKVRKYYKLNSLTWLEGLPDWRKRIEQEALILSAMALNISGSR